MPWPADNPASNGSEIRDRTGSWTTPFAFSLGLLLFAIVRTYRIIRPDRSIEGVPPCLDAAATIEAKVGHHGEATVGAYLMPAAGPVIW